MESAEEEWADLMEEARQNREQYKNRIAFRAEASGWATDQILTAAQKPFDVMAAEIEKMPKKIPTGRVLIRQCRTREEGAGGEG